MLKCSWLLVLPLIILAACGKERRFGDPEGEPVTITVNLERDYVRALSRRRVGTSVGAGVGFGSGGARSSGVGVGLSFSATTVTLLGGEGAAEGQIFRRELKWGESSFTVPLRPGRTLYLTAQASGGYQGWEGIGSVIIPEEAPADGPHRVTVVLTGDTISATVP